MLPKKHRLTRSAFACFFQSGRRFHTTHLTLIYTPTETFFGAVVVSKKVARLSVDRHRLRRRLYNLLATYCIVRPGTYILIAKKGALEVTRSELQAELDTVITKVHTTCGNTLPKKQPKTPPQKQDS